MAEIDSPNWIRVKDTVTICFDLLKGKSFLEIQG
jgi:hypothetical protein